MWGPGHSRWKLVVLESPYGGNTRDLIERHVKYAMACLRDCLERGESPIARHLLLTQRGVFDDKVPEERKHGIAAGNAWIAVSDAVVVYQDMGISAGMW